MIEFAKQDLAAAVAFVRGAIDTKATIPVMQNIHITTGDNVATLRASNLELDLSTTINAFCDKSEIILVPLKAIDLINKRAGERVNIEAGSNALLLKSGKVKLKEEIRKPSDYPVRQNGTLKKLGTIKGNVMADLLAASAGSSTEESRYALQNVQLIKDGDTLYCRATMGQLVTLCEIKDKSFIECNYLLPGLLIDKISAILTDAEYVIEADENIFRLTHSVNGDVLQLRQGSGQMPAIQMVTDQAKTARLIDCPLGLVDAATLGVDFFNDRKTGNKIIVDVANKIITATSDRREITSDAEGLETLGIDKMGFDPVLLGKVFAWMEKEGMKIGIVGTMLAVTSKSPNGVNQLTTLASMKL